MKIAQYLVLLVIVSCLIKVANSNLNTEREQELSNHLYKAEVENEDLRYQLGQCKLFYIGR